MPCAFLSHGPTNAEYWVMRVTAMAFTARLTVGIVGAGGCVSDRVDPSDPTGPGQDLPVLDPASPTAPLVVDGRYRLDPTLAVETQAPRCSTP